MERRISVKRRKYKQPFSKKFKEYFRNFVAFMFSNVGIILLVISYTVMGAGIFRELEAENFVRHHRKLAANITRIRQVTAKELYNITYNLNPSTEPVYRKAVSDTLKEFQVKVVYAIRRGFESSNETLVSAKWSYPGAFLYSLTVITTIGYGNMCPITPQGKIVTIIYAIVGMPLFLLYLSNIGDVLARSFKWIYANLCLCRWCPGVSKRRAERQKRRYGSEESWEKIDAAEVDGGRTSSTSVEIEDTENEESEQSYDVQSVTVPVSICLLIMVGYICGGALLFGSIEKWQFLNASYFCFISLSTIGFGDFVPGSEIWNNEHKEGLFEWSFVFCSMYLMLGMALIAMCFNLMQEEVIHKIKTVIRTVKYILGCRR